MSKSETIKALVHQLDLTKHPEGGYYREIYRSPKISEFPGNPPRNHFTIIHYLLGENEFSAFHKLSSDETWFYHEGCSMHIYILGDEEIEIMKLGPDKRKGESLVQVVEGGSWFAARPAEKSSYSLVSCQVVPGFDFRDFELASREDLLMSFPHAGNLIKELTRH